MILHQMRMLNGKPLWDGRMKVFRRSDRCKRLYAEMRKGHRRMGGRLR